MAICKGELFNRAVAIMLLILPVIYSNSFISVSHLLLVIGTHNHFSIKLNMANIQTNTSVGAKFPMRHLADCWL